VIVELECLATPPGTEANRYAHIEAAIAVIQESGLHYEVSPLGTTVEGEPDVIWPLMRRVHESCLEAGANSLVTVVKVYQARPEYQMTMDGLTGKFRA